jgi:hypothetical protein
METHIVAHMFYIFQVGCRYFNVEGEGQPHTETQLLWCVGNAPYGKTTHAGPRRRGTTKRAEHFDLLRAKAEACR